MALTRRSLVARSAVACSAAAVARYNAGAAEFEPKYATDAPADNIMPLRVADAIGKIKQDTNGRVDIKLFAGGALGNTTSLFTQVRAGAVEFYMAGDVMAGVVPVAVITATPFVFSNINEVLRVLSGSLGKYRLAAIRRAGIYPLSQVWSNGFRNLCNSVRPIFLPADLAGLKIRVPPGPVTEATIRALGGAPTALGAADMYTGLQTHLVDGIELSITAIEAFKLYEVQRFVSYTNHQWTGYTPLCNVDYWQSLPKNLQDVVERRLNEAGAAECQEVPRLDAGTEAKLKSQGMQFNQVSDIKAFQAALRRSGLYAKLRELFGTEAWSMLERAVGRLA